MLCFFIIISIEKNFLLPVPALCFSGGSKLCVFTVSYNKINVIFVLFSKAGSITEDTWSRYTSQDPH